MKQTVPGQLLSNEFATVEVHVDTSANGVRLMIRDMATGTTVYLDPLELEALTRASHDYISALLASR